MAARVICMCKCAGPAFDVLKPLLCCQRHPAKAILILLGAWPRTRSAPGNTTATTGATAAANCTSERRARTQAGACLRGLARPVPDRSWYLVRFLATLQDSCTCKRIRMLTRTPLAALPPPRSQDQVRDCQQAPGLKVAQDRGSVQGPHMLAVPCNTHAAGCEQAADPTFSICVQI